MPEKKMLTQAEFAVIVRAHQTLQAGRAGGQRANLAFHDLRGLDMTRANLSDADFTGCDLQRVRAVQTKLARTLLFGTDLRVATLHHADLTRADLRGGCLRGADLSDATLVDADMREGVLAWHDGSNGAQAVEYKHQNAEVSAVNAQRADFSSAKMSGAMVVQTDF
ncbi:MAG: pentapeptide repeat-containing protein, partial [Alphaproteobacteria bacterium]|nr:pentapeptide repeat-containing protein [Alphaproteobacteria bacterium]